MKKVILLIGIMLVSLLTFPQLNADAKAKCKAYAKDKWGTDYSMVQYEYNRQVEAGNEFTSKYFSLGCGNENPKTLSDECLIYVQAYSKWSYEDTEWVDWEMALYEAKKQMEAYQNLK